MKKFLILITIALTATLAVRAQEEQGSGMVTEATAARQYTKADADSAYAAGEYATAVALYEQLLAEGESATLYYNLGNSYFKSDDIAHAILCYERALVYNPSDRDAQFNLELAESRAVDRVTPKAEIFFLRWYHQFAALLPADMWAIGAVVAFVLCLVATALFIFCRRRGGKKAAFAAAVVLLVATLCMNGLATTQKRRITHRECAIVMSPSVTVRSTPGPNGVELFVLHEGRKVTIKDDTMQSWKEIELEDGNVGWIEAKDIERI